MIIYESQLEEVFIRLVSVGSDFYVSTKRYEDGSREKTHKSASLIEAKKVYLAEVLAQLRKIDP